MKKNRVRMVLFLTFSPGILLFATQEVPIGRIVYLEGLVGLYRNGEALELSNSDIGREVYTQDLVETYAGGMMEIELSVYINPGTIVKVLENSAFYLDLSQSMGGSHTNFSLLMGGLAFKVQELSDAEKLTISTQSAVMEAGSSNFEIVSAPEGSILVVCTEGKVICEDDYFNQQFALSGRVVEKRSGEALRRISLVPGEEVLYKTFWANQREQVFKAGAPSFVRAYAKQYLNSLPSFAGAYRKITSHRQTLLRYGGGLEEERNSDVFLIYNKVREDIAPVRRVVKLFEHIYYSINILMDYHDRGIGRTRITSEMNSREFFESFTAYEPVLKSQIAEMHYLYKLFSNLASLSSGGSGQMSQFKNSQSDITKEEMRLPLKLP